MKREDLTLLRSYSWPGNVRELGAVIERAAILGHGRRLALREALAVAPVPQASPAARPPSQAAAPAPEGRGLDAAIIREIESALNATNGKIEGPTGAAALLGINPHTLRSRMRKLGIHWARFRA